MSAAPGSRLRRLALQALKLVVVLGALAWLLGSGRLQPARLLASRPSLVALGALLTLLPFLLTFFRLHLLLGAMGSPLGLLTVVRIGFIGSFFNTFMPGSLGGDLVKVGYLARVTTDGAVATAAVLLDRLLALLAILTIGGLALLASWSEVQASPALQRLAWIVAVLLGSAAWSGVVAIAALARGRRLALLIWLLMGLVALLAWLSLIPAGEPSAGGSAGGFALGLGLDAAVALAALLVVPSVAPGGGLASLISDRVPGGGLLLRFVDAVLLARHHLGLLAALILLSVLSQSTSVVALFVFGRAMDLPLALSQVFATAPLAFLVNTVPVPGGGLGVGEAAMASLLELFSHRGQPVAGGAAMFLAWRLWVILWGLIGLPLYLHGGARLRAAVQPPPSPPAG